MNCRLDEELVLKSWNGSSVAQILSLVILSLPSLKEITQELKGREWESSYRVLVVQFEMRAKEREWRGMEWYIYSLLRKLAVVQQLPGESGLTSRYSVPGAPTFRAETQTLQSQLHFHSKLFLVRFLSGFLAHWVYTSFLSTRFESQPTDQSPLDSTAFLYSNIK